MIQNNNIVNSISEVVEYIEDNIKQKISLDDLAAFSHFSKFHLSRIFKSIINKNIMEYVRHRKLSRSVNELLNTGLKITDVAYEYNFSHPASYIRSFKNTFGISPKKLLKEKVPISIQEKLDVGKITSIYDNSFVLTPEIMLKAPFNIIGIKTKIYFKDNIINHTAAKAGKHFMENQMHKISNPLNSSIYIGLSQFNKDKSEYKYYMPSIHVGNLKKIPDGMEGLKIKSNYYAVFKFVFFENIENISINSFQKEDLYINEWLSNSDYEMIDYYMFESIDTSLLREDYCEIEIFVPVRKKQNNQDCKRILLPLQL